MLSTAKIFSQAQTQLDHNRLITLINSLGDAFLAVNAHGVIELSNGAALNLLDTNALEGKNLSDVVRLIDSSGRAVDIRSLIGPNHTPISSKDYRINTAAKLPVNIFLSLSPVKTAYGPSNDDGGFVIVMRDITSEKMQEEDRDEFIGVASHELRSPIAIVEGSISNAMLIAKQSHVSETVIQILDSAHSQVTFLGSLINDLAMLSRAERGKTILNPEAVNIIELVDSLKHDYEPQARQKGLELITMMDQGLPVISSNRLYIREILQNFITNSIKYTESGSVTLKISSDNAGVAFSVIDTGVGIQDMEKSKIFSKFFRSEDARVQKHSGTGLGLYISNKLAHLLGGSIGIDSTVNHGSTFSLFIPNSHGDKTVLPKSDN